MCYVQIAHDFSSNKLILKIFTNVYVCVSVYFDSLTDQSMPNYKSEIQKIGWLRPKMSVIEQRNIVICPWSFRRDSLQALDSIPPLKYYKTWAIFASVEHTDAP